MELMFFCLLVSGFGIQSYNTKEYSDNDVYISNYITTYDNITTNCSLFGSKFDENYPVDKLMINITKTGTYWIGAKIGFKRNINPYRVQSGCNVNYNGSLDECNKHCKGRKYFSYNEHSCTCSNENMAIVGLSRTKNCKDQKHGLCFDNNCVVYERGEFFLYSSTRNIFGTHR
ncbi:unnamed protein product [Mytilus edulis]|uniref:Uncharacterized protein n=1 Tax=Mytilus edulis TaxID=6550 RepID=A0A8S3SYK3_MYTED|nr:unnamed protein product [Mytilus edulis]